MADPLTIKIGKDVAPRVVAAVCALYGYENNAPTALPGSSPSERFTPEEFVAAAVKEWLTELVRAHEHQQATAAATDAVQRIEL